MKTTQSIPASLIPSYIVAISGNNEYRGVLHFSSAKFAYASLKNLRSLEKEQKDIHKNFKVLPDELEKEKLELDMKTQKLIRQFVPGVTEQEMGKGVQYSRSETPEEFKKAHDSLKEEYADLLKEIDSIESQNKNFVKDLGDIQVDIWTVSANDLPSQISGIQLSAIEFMLE